MNDLLELLNYLKEEEERALTLGEKHLIARIRGYVNSRIDQYDAGQTAQLEVGNEGN